MEILIRIFRAAVLAFLICLPTADAAKAGFSVDVARPEFDFGVHFPQGEVWDIAEDLELTSGSAAQAALFINDRVRLSYGDFLYDSSIRLGNANAFLQANVNSQWNLNYAGIGYFYPIHFIPGIQSEAILDLKRYRLRTRAAGGLYDHKLFESGWLELEGLVPAIGIKLTKSMTDSLLIYGEVLGIPSNALASYMDWDAGVRYAGEAIAMQVGFRQISVKAPYSPLQAELKAQFSGPYFGVAYSF